MSSHGLTGKREKNKIKEYLIKSTMKREKKDIEDTGESTEGGKIKEGGDKKKVGRERRES